MDLDFLTWTTGDGDAKFVLCSIPRCLIFDDASHSSTSIDTILDDSDVACQYTGIGWVNSPNNLQQFYFNGTMQSVFKSYTNYHFIACSIAGQIGQMTRSPSHSLEVP